MQEFTKEQIEEISKEFEDAEILESVKIYDTIIVEVAYKQVTYRKVTCLEETPVEGSIFKMVSFYHTAKGKKYFVRCSGRILFTQELIK